MVTFNSRYLTYKQVSEQFIPTQNFYDLAKACHTVLLGARGSGKTTMLKMLQPEAIIEFQKVDNSFDVPFYGVYIPSDRQWRPAPRPGDRPAWERRTGPPGCWHRLR